MSSSLSQTHAEIESADKDIDRPVTQPECNEYQFSATSHEERPSRRRSLSTGDAEDLGSSVGIIPPSLLLLAQICFRHLRQKGVQVA